MIPLEGKNIEFSFGDMPIIKKIDIEVPKSKISVILGPNGSGKSTLLKTLAKLYRPSKGKVLLNGKDINLNSGKEVARNLSLMSQAPLSPDGITVKDLIFFGRHPYQGLFSLRNKKDIDAVENALVLTNLKDLEYRFLDELSGGQRQRAWLGMAISQETNILLLDEPTTYLDLHYQFEILDLLKGLNEKKKTTIIMVLHDLNLASLYGDHLFVMNDGKLHSEGTPEKCLTKELLEDVFKINVHEKKTIKGKPQFTFSSNYCH